MNAKKIPLAILGSAAGFFAVTFTIYFFNLDMKFLSRFVEPILLKIKSGELPPGAKLPTERELAHELGVARGTVKKAYAELERRGLCYSVAGTGRVISPGAPEALRASRQALLRDVAEKTGQLAQAGIPLSDIVSAVTRAYNEAKQGGAT